MRSVMLQINEYDDDVDDDDDDDRWNQLDQRAVDASNINAFKGCLSKTRETRMCYFMD